VSFRKHEIQGSENLRISFTERKLSLQRQPTSKTPNPAQTPIATSFQLQLPQQQNPKMQLENSLIKVGCSRPRQLLTKRKQKNRLPKPKRQLLKGQVVGKPYMRGWLVQPPYGAGNINTKEAIAALLILKVIVVIGSYMVFQQQPQKSQRSDVDWSTTFHHDLAHTGHSTSAGPLTNQTLWSYLTQNDMEYPSPAVVDGVSYFGSNDWRVHAVNASTGSKIWSFLTGSSMYSSSAVVNGTVYFGADKTVYALDASSGEKIWNYTSGSVGESSPAVANNVVYIGSNDHNVYALDAANGNKIWNYTTGNMVNGSPTVADGVVYIGSKDNNVYALDASTGSKIWSYLTGSQIESTPSIANGILYIGSNDDKVYAFGSIATP
jgi:outer membrane protein assembly factor BamB